jgi:hypothetical protein
VVNGAAILIFAAVVFYRMLPERLERTRGDIGRGGGRR